jgi:diacylglycerol kinase family enzyme
MKIEFFAEALAEICRRSLVAPEMPLRWLIVANPAAGGFTMRSRLKKCRAELDQCLTAARQNPLRTDCSPAGIKSEVSGSPALASCGLVQTTGHGSASKYAEALIGEAKTQNTPFYLVISAGGDGTSREILTAMYHAPETVRSNMAILRLPMGTGNDGADSNSLVEALMLLIKPSRIDFNPALRLVTAPAGPAANGPASSAQTHLAFNILSVGLDAFVTHMTNKMKGKLPGDSYKLWVDIASLLYDRIYKVDFLDIKADGGKITLREKLLLLAVGASGHRTYGSQKKILPDDRNVCALKQMPLLRKLALKDLFTTGKHIDKPETILFNARHVEFSGSFPLLAQMDGETILLQPEDFPSAIELTDPVIPVLKKDNNQ